MHDIKTNKQTKILNRKKNDPNTFVYTGNKIDDKIHIQLYEYNAESCIEIIENKDLILPNINSPKINWLNIHGLNNINTISSICNNFNLHKLVIQDILDINQRPKYQEFDNYFFFTIKAIVPSESDIITEQISFILNNNFLISFQERKADYFNHIRTRLKDNLGIVRQRGTDYLLFTLLEAILDNYFKAIVKIENELDTFTKFNNSNKFTPDLIINIENYKKQLRTIKKLTKPIRDFTASIERKQNKYVEDRHIKYYFELNDLCLTIIENCESLETELESSTNLFFSIQGHNLNQVMKTLTIVATIFIPLTFIAGIYGMNFSNMPELEWQYGYIFVWSIIIFIFFIMIYYFKKKNWF